MNAPVAHILAPTSGGNQNNRKLGSYVVECFDRLGMKADDFLSFPCVSNWCRDWKERISSKANASSR